MDIKIVVALLVLSMMVLTLINGSLSEKNSVAGSSDLAEGYCPIDKQVKGLYLGRGMPPKPKKCRVLPISEEDMCQKFSEEYEVTRKIPFGRVLRFQYDATEDGPPYSLRYTGTPKIRNVCFVHEMNELNDKRASKLRENRA